jgi:hypothetical protein
MNEKHYINNDQFTDILINYYNDPDSKTGKKYYEQIGKIFLLLANKIINGGNFRNYPEPLKEEMINDAVYLMIKKLNKYDHEKYSNPFSYFTTVTLNVIYQHIKKEKKRIERNVRLDTIEINGLEYLVADSPFKDKLEFGKVKTSSKHKKE